MQRDGVEEDVGIMGGPDAQVLRRRLLHSRFTARVRPVIGVRRLDDDRRRREGGERLDGLEAEVAQINKESEDVEASLDIYAQSRPKGDKGRTEDGSLGRQAQHGKRGNKTNKSSRGRRGGETILYHSTSRYI